MGEAGTSLFTAPLAPTLRNFLSPFNFERNGPGRLPGGQRDESRGYLAGNAKLASRFALLRQVHGDARSVFLNIGLNTPTDTVGLWWHFA